MLAVIGSTLPLALGIAISPMAIIAAVLMLLSPKARATATGFLVGWLVGIVAATTVFTLVGGLLPASEPGPPATIRGVIHLAVGVLLLVLAVRQWRRRPTAGEPAPLPAWMRAIDSISWPAAAAAGFGFLLSGLSPKNLLLAAAAGVEIGAAALPMAETVAVVAIVVLLAGATVLIPVAAYLVAAERLRAPLGALRGWLAAENAVIMSVLLLVLGVVLIGKGIASV